MSAAPLAVPPAASPDSNAEGAWQAALASLAGKSILITGGGGYIASRVAGLLGEVDCRIVRLARTAPAAADLPRAGVEDRIADVRDESVWKDALGGIDAVIHLAAQTSTYEANRDPQADLRANVLPMLRLLQACAGMESPPMIVNASTVTVCGLPTRLPVDESHAGAPVTVYDLHKQMAENYLRYFARAGAARGLSLRLSNVYGPGPRSSRGDRGILNQMAARALRGEALTIYGSGEQVRDYLYVDDAARAFILAAACKATAADGRPCIVASGEGHRIADALRLVAERASARTGHAVNVVNVPAPAGLSPIEARHFVGDTRLFRETTGWAPRVALRPGIDLLIESLL